MTHIRSSVSVMCGLLLVSILTAAVMGQTVLTLDPAVGELPVSIAFDRGGNAWVSLQPLCQLRQYGPDWREITRIQLIDNCTAGAGASGLAFDSEGSLYAAAIGPDSVRGVYIIGRRGGKMRLAGTEQIAFPNALAFEDDQRALFVTDMSAGAIWRIPRLFENDGESGEADDWAPSFGSPQRWISGALFEGQPGWPGGPSVGVNGIAVHRGRVLVSVTFPDRIVSVPIREDGSAGMPVIIADTAALLAVRVAAIDDICVDVFGNIYAAQIAAAFGVAKISADGSQITHIAGTPAAATSVAFGNRGWNHKVLFVAFNPAFGGAAAGIAAFDLDVPGRHLP